MPIVAHNALPTFDHLRREGLRVLPPDRALHQDIRELHIGLLNMMPDKALAATERQFFVHPFTLPELERGPEARAHVERFYDSFDRLQQEGLDALIITGANVVGPDLASQPFWDPLIRVIDWAADNVTSTLCSCLATHAVLEFRYGQKRTPRPEKTWGVFPHRVMDPEHPLVNDVNTRFDVPHSRWNEVTRAQFVAAGLRVLVESPEVGVHLATSHDGFRFVFFQGHPEYDTVSLLKEYKREVLRFERGETGTYPPYPENYLHPRDTAMLAEYRLRTSEATARCAPAPDFPESLVARGLDNTWHDTGEAILGNWMGLVYQLTHSDRRKPFMDGIDPENPLGLNIDPA